MPVFSTSSVLACDVLWCTAVSRLPLWCPNVFYTTSQVLLPAREEMLHRGPVPNGLHSSLVSMYTVRCGATVALLAPKRRRTCQTPLSQHRNMPSCEQLAAPAPASLWLLTYRPSVHAVLMQRLQHLSASAAHLRPGTCWYSFGAPLPAPPVPALRNLGLCTVVAHAGMWRAAAVSLKWREQCGHCMKLGSGPEGVYGMPARLSPAASLRTHAACSHGPLVYPDWSHSVCWRLQRWSGPTTVLHGPEGAQYTTLCTAVAAQNRSSLCSGLKRAQMPATCCMQAWQH